MLSQEDFIARSKKVQKKEFDYSQTVYTGMTNKVSIICPEHGIFTQSPQTHIKGANGCQGCGHRGRKDLMNTEKFIERAISVHGDNKFDYSDTSYSLMRNKVKVRCIKHNIVFDQLPQAHLKGLNGCKECNGQKPIDREEFVRRSKKIYGENRFDYSKVSEIKGIHTAIILICNIHNIEYVQEAWSNLNNKVGCYECNLVSKKSPDKIIRKSFEIHNKEFDFSKTDWSKNVRDKNIIGCNIKEHGFFEQTLDGLLSGKTGCRICDKENRLTSLDDFILRVEKIHSNKYGFDKVVLTNGLQGTVTLKCLKHDEYFTYSIFRVLQGLEGCLKCRTNGTSKKEKEVSGFIEELGFNIIKNDRTLIKPRELDIYIPSKNIAIEFNGLYWHSDRYLDNNYHYNKWRSCHDKGVRLISIWEDDWDNKRVIVENHIKSVLGVNNQPRIYARNTIVKNINKNDARDFLNENHIQGFVGSSVYLGLFSDTSLVAIASFTKKGNDYLLSRYATSCSVIGGHSKLVSYFEKNYSYNKLITFADRTFSNGDLYRQTGWVVDGEVPADYYYIVDNVRFHKFGFRKERFKKDPNLIFETGKTESELAVLNRLDRIWDAGKVRFIKTHP